MILGSFYMFLVGLAWGYLIFEFLQKRSDRKKPPEKPRRNKRLEDMVRRGQYREREALNAILVALEYLRGNTDADTGVMWTKKQVIDLLDNVMVMYASPKVRDKINQQRKDRLDARGKRR